MIENVDVRFSVIFSLRVASTEDNQFGFCESKKNVKKFTFLFSDTSLGIIRNMREHKNSQNSRLRCGKL